MISDLSEIEILNYIMTSEFQDGLTPDEFRLLIIRLRNFYRVSNSKVETLKSEIDGKKKEIDDMINLYTIEIENLNTINKSITEEMQKIYSRKLSIGKIISGKINKNVK